MNATVSDLVEAIGEQTVELRLLRRELSDLQVASNLKDQEINALKEALDKIEEKETKKKEK